ncbi:hypothetical protein HHUSO_G27844 [Huso huso]|uniref:Uncharacterized protein n=1 Tax=Huso huso TaxID=61971 RepID=A0ABR0YKM0_HUSHU
MESAAPDPSLYTIKALFILDSDDNWLLAKEERGEALPGGKPGWCVPGGGRDRGQRMSAAMMHSRSSSAFAQQRCIRTATMHSHNNGAFTQQRCIHTLCDSGE